MTVFKRKKNITSRVRLLRRQLSEQLKQGLGPRDLALALALGATVGLMPLVWGTSLLCIVLAACLRLNQVVVQVANYLVYPLQIVLFLPVLFWAQQLFGSFLMPDDVGGLVDLIKHAPGQFLLQFWQVNLQALLVWLILSPLIFAMSFALIYCGTRFFLWRQFARKRALWSPKHQI